MNKESESDTNQTRRGFGRLIDGDESKAQIELRRASTVDNGQNERGDIVGPRGRDHGTTVDRVVVVVMEQSAVRGEQKEMEVHAMHVRELAVVAQMCALFVGQVEFAATTGTLDVE